MNNIDDFFLPAAMADEVSIFPIINMDGNPDISQVELPTDLPLLALRNAILFPHTLIPITVGREKSVKVIRDVFETTKLLGAVTQLDPDLDDPKSKDLFRYGCLAKILKIIEMPDGGLTAILHGYTRIEILQVVSEQPYFKAKVRYIKDKLTDSDSDMAAITGAIKDSALQILRLSPNMPQEAAFAIKNLEGVEFLINFIASNVEMEQLDEKLALLAEGNLKER
ncbi:MAG: LON peptidase substrate-binding domain-containing protein, partial [Bacteroidales bacterium]|nr:LON peptidase substrate-binding domain-containing protein [Bacteroidales bacterium]